MFNPQSEISHYIPQFVWKFWLSQLYAHYSYQLGLISQNFLIQSGPNDLPRDPRVHIYNVYDNELSETRQLPVQSGSVFKDLTGDPTSVALVQTAEQAFYHLESESESTLTQLIERTYTSGTPTKTNSFCFDRKSVESLSRYLTFLRFRNSAKYREILQSLEEPTEESHKGIIYPAYGPIMIELRRRVILREFIKFLQYSSDVGGACLPRDPRLERHTSSGAPFDTFRDAMDSYCWRLCGAEVFIGIASEDQEFIFPDSCFGTLDEGFDEDP
jgi:hypothetical protein